MERFQSLQVLRFAAAAMVVYLHALNAAEAAGLSHGWATTAPFRQNGATGVDIFFGISGAVIYSSALQRGMNPAVFVRKRLVRIVPTYWVFTVAWLLVALVGLGLQFRPTELLASFTFWPAWGRMDVPALDAGWTLCFEMLFYAGVAVALAVNGAWKWLLAAYVVAFVAQLGPPAPALEFVGSPLVLEFLGGVMVMRYLPKNIPAWAALGLLAIGATILLALPFDKALFDYRLNMDGSTALPRVVLAGVPSLAVLAGVLGLDRFVRGRFWAAPLFLGDASYAIYLANWVLFHTAIPLLRGSDVPALLVLLVGAPATIAIGALAHLLVERPLLAAFQGRSPAALAQA